MKKSFIKKLAIVVSLSLLGAGVGYYLIHRAPTQTAIEQGPIVSYNEARDHDEIVNIFQTEKHWLLSSDDYDVEMLLKYKAPNENPLYFGKAHIKTYLDNGQFAGFSTYYKKTPNEGTILFIAVKKEFRNRGIAK